ncbi:MAG: dihydrofolate reductase [Pseudomonadota bacterium]
MVEFVQIAAVATNGVIGKNGALPFRLPSDLKRFKALTTGHPVIMGRLTYESIGRALPGRPNIIVSGNPEFRAEGCEVFPDLETALERGRQLAEGLRKDAVFILGGGQVYAQTLADADRLEITHVDAQVDGDTVFPVIDPEIWHKVAEDRPAADPRDEAPMVFATYRRR